MSSWVNGAYHVASTVDLHEGEVARRLDLAVLLAVGFEGRELSALEGLVARPLELVGPGLVAEPVADEVSITSIDQHGNLLQNTRDEEVEWLHPVALEKEVPVNVEVAAVVTIDGLNTQGGHDVLLVEVLVNVAQARVAKASSLARDANIVGVLAGSLVCADNRIVAVDRGGDTAEEALGLVAAADHGLASRQGIVHRRAVFGADNSVVATLAAGHGTVLGVLGVGVGQAIANQNGLQVDVAVLVGEDLRGKNRDVVTGVRFARDVEVLLGILREFLEEQRQQRIDVLAGGDSVGDRVTAVRVTDIYRLVKEDDGCVAVPGAGVVLDLDIVVDGRGAKLEEETGEGGTAWATVEPKDNGVVLGVVA